MILRANFVIQACVLAIQLVFFGYRIHDGMVPVKNVVFVAIAAVGLWLARRWLPSPLSSGRG